MELELEQQMGTSTGTRNQSKLSTHAVVFVVGAIDGAMKDEGEVKTNGDIFGLWELLEKRLDLYLDKFHKLLDNSLQL